MANSSETGNIELSVDDSELSVAKQRGVCKIKAQFIIEDHVRGEKEEFSRSGNKEDINDEPLLKKSKGYEKKEKPRGQNKQRPAPFRGHKEQSLCPWLVDQVPGELDNKCPGKSCKFMHSRLEYMKIKEQQQPDIAPDCYVFNLTGKCPRGTACRFGSKHLNADGSNIIDHEKYDKFKEKPSATKNQIQGKALQEELRKRRYDFSRSERIIKDDLLKKMQMIEDKRNGKNEIGKKVLWTEDDRSNNGNVGEIKRMMIGPVADNDLIKLRDCEKRKIDWRDKILLSPLTTVGNLPFRRICKEYGADITCGEMTLAPKILKAAPEEWALVKRYETEDIFGVQICGNNTGVLTRCAQLLNEQAEIDYVDLNLGCPIELIYKQGGGSGMLNRKNVLQSVVKCMSQVLDVPLTIKSRMGVYMDKPIAHTLMPQFKEWGASMITVHGRSREQRYSKLADWNYIERCAVAASPIPIYGNGDIMCYDDYLRVKEQSPSIQGVTIGRGALIKPWIFREIKEKRLIDIPSTERLDILKKYANYGLDHWGSDTRGVETTRRFMLEWISFLHRYIPVGILESPPQRINERPPYYRGRDETETLMASSNCADWIKVSEIFLGKVPDGFHFLPKHKANSWN